MKRLFFLTLLVLITINIAGAEKEDYSPDTSSRSVVIPISSGDQLMTPSFLLTPTTVCKNLRNTADFELLVEIMTAKVMGNLEADFSSEQLRHVNRESIAADIRSGLLKKTQEKAKEDLATKT